jgi:hypothetical protein
MTARRKNFDLMALGFGVWVNWLAALSKIQYTTKKN